MLSGTLQTLFYRSNRNQYIAQEGKKLNSEKLQEYCNEYLACGNIVHIVSQFRKLFDYEKTYQEKDYTASEIRKHRQAKQEPILSDFLYFIESLKGDYTKINQKWEK